MDAALVVGRLLLAVVFTVAGIAKLADRAGARTALGEFGVPGHLRRPLGVALPLAELAVAAALLPTASSRWGALGALGLLALFVAAISVNLALGRRPECHCFGQVRSAPAGALTLARNGALLALAAFVAWAAWSASSAGAVALPSGLTSAQLVGAVGAVLGIGLVAALAWMQFGLLRQNGRLLLRLEALEARLDAAGVAPAPAAEEGEQPAFGLPVGSPAPTFSLSGLFGETLTLDFLRSAGKPVFIVFSDPNCGPCNALLPEMGAWQRDHEAKLTVALISRGAADENRAKSQEHGLTLVLLQQERELDERYQIQGTPSAVVIRADGTIGSSVAAGADAIRALLATTVGAAGVAAPTLSPATVAANGHAANGSAAAAVDAATPRIGDRAPKVRLRDLTGRWVNLGRPRGRRMLIVFWNTQCGFCRAMLDDLKAWEAKPPKNAPKLVVVSRGTVEDNRAMRLRAPVVLDTDGSAMSAFGATGTPSALIVDEQGKIASELAVGGPAVLDLAGVEQPSAQPMQTPPAPAIGQPAPAIELRDLSGKARNLREFRGKRTLVLFWNPQCGFCEAMLDDLKTWEAKPPKGAPRLVVVSRGTVEENRAMRLRAPVLLDPDWSATGAFGANGTPMAVRLDEDGKIASDVVAGAAAVLELARSAEAQPARA